MVAAPAVLPDECARGYLGRVLRINGWRDARSHELSMMEQFMGERVSRKDMSMGELLARMVQADLERFVRSHSMYPLRRAVTDDIGGGLLGEGSRREQAFRQLFWMPRSRAYFCRACIEEDLGFHGVSYWRREHQISGQYQCRKHGMPLRSVEPRRHHAFHQSPAWILSESDPSLPELLSGQISSPAADRYLEICSHLLLGAKVLSSEAVSHVLVRRANQLGMEVDERCVFRSLLWSPEVQGCFDERWLKSAFRFNVSGLLRNKNAGVWNSTFVSALIFGALYQSADEAINAMTCASHAGNRAASQTSQSSPS